MSGFKKQIKKPLKKIIMSIILFGEWEDLNSAQVSRLAQASSDHGNKKSELLFFLLLDNLRNNNFQRTNV